MTKVESMLVDEEILAELGARLEKRRLDFGYTQAHVAREAGVSVRTLARLEAGAVASQLSTFLRVCRVLEVLDAFENAIPSAKMNPLDELQRASKSRRRASSVPSPWVWGDEE